MAHNFNLNTGQDSTFDFSQETFDFTQEQTSLSSDDLTAFSGRLGQKSAPAHPNNGLQPPAYTRPFLMPRTQKSPMFMPLGQYSTPQLVFTGGTCPTGEPIFNSVPQPTFSGGTCPTSVPTMHPTPQPVFYGGFYSAARPGSHASNCLTLQPQAFQAPFQVPHFQTHPGFALDPQLMEPGPVASEGTTESKRSEPVECICGSGTDKTRVKRPRNAFIFFRIAKAQDIQRQLKAQGLTGALNQKVSMIAGEMWHNASESEKQHYNDKAAEEKARHAAENPGYKYQPRKAGGPRNEKFGTPFCTCGVYEANVQRASQAGNHSIPVPAIQVPVSTASVPLVASKSRALIGASVENLTAFADSNTLFSMEDLFPSPPQPVQFQQNAYPQQNVCSQQSVLQQNADSQQSVPQWDAFSDPASLFTEQTVLPNPGNFLPEQNGSLHPQQVNTNATMDPNVTAAFDLLSIDDWTFGDLSALDEPLDIETPETEVPIITFPKPKQNGAPAQTAEPAVLQSKLALPQYNPALLKFTVPSSSDPSSLSSASPGAELINTDHFNLDHFIIDPEDETTDSLFNDDTDPLFGSLPPTTPQLPASGPPSSPNVSIVTVQGMNRDFEVQAAGPWRRASLEISSRDGIAGKRKFEEEEGVTKRVKV